MVKLEKFVWGYVDGFLEVGVKWDKIDTWGGARFTRSKNNYTGCWIEKDWESLETEKNFKCADLKLEFSFHFGHTEGLEWSWWMKSKLTGLRIFVKRFGEGGMGKFWFGVLWGVVKKRDARGSWQRVFGNWEISYFGWLHLDDSVAAWFLLKLFWNLNFRIFLFWNLIILEFSYFQIL